VGNAKACEGRLLYSTDVRGKLKNKKMKAQAESLESPKSDLEENMPQYTYKIGKRVYGKCIIAKKGNFSGADIYLKKKALK